MTEIADRPTAARTRRQPAPDATADLRQPPQDLSAEQSVLGGMLLSKDAIADVLARLRPGDFYRPNHQAIYDVILDLYARGEPADAVTVAAELDRRGLLTRIGGAPYLHTLIETVPTAANAGYYAGIVAEKALLRRLVEAGTRVVQYGYAGAEGADVDEVIDRAQAEVYDVTDHRSSSDDLVALDDLLQPTLDDLDAIASNGGIGKGVPTGFPDLDALTNGLHAGQMVVIAARPGVGKALALDTPLPTPHGWTTMGAVSPGDTLLDAHGRPTRVVAATPVLQGRPCYELSFADGSHITADAEHQWPTAHGLRTSAQLWRAVQRAGAQPLISSASLVHRGALCGAGVVSHPRDRRRGAGAADDVARSVTTWAGNTRPIWRTTGAHRHVVVDIRPVTSVAVRCVQVDNESHLYLAGPGCVPTHNSTLALDFMRSCSIKHKLPSVLFSLEMSKSEIVMRLLSAEAKVKLASMRAGRMSDDEWTRIARCMSELSEAPLYIDDSPNLTMMEIRAKARRLRQRCDLRLIVVDYLQLLTSGKRYESRQQEVSDFSRGLKLLAKELDVPVVALSQLNRGPEQRADKRPQVSDLRESGSLEQDPDMVILLHRPDAIQADDPRGGEADLILGKHRNGPTGTVTVAHQLHYSRFTPMAHMGH
ncbi:MAG: replicative DNA helicase [Mycolicibacterium sp.]|uniref:replicative DNA helicase n=1 Tax=Mycolicibacterium sp. TaxID=2320850 RepID=UPI003D0EBE7A